MRKFLVFLLIFNLVEAKGRKRASGKGSKDPPKASFKKCNLRIEDWDKQLQPSIVAVAYISTQRPKSRQNADRGPIYGFVHFAQQRFRGPTRIRGLIKNLEGTGKHAAFITEKGLMDCNGKIPDEDKLEEEARSWRISVHYNPFNSKHGKSTSCYRHVGDLDQIEANQTAGGWTNFTMFDARIQLLGPTSVIGRNFVILYKQEDEENENGHRYACGTIGMAYKANYRVSEYVIPRPEDGNAYFYGFGGTFLALIYLVVYECHQRSKERHNRRPNFKSKRIQERHQRILLWRIQRME